MNGMRIAALVGVALVSGTLAAQDMAHDGEISCFGYEGDFMFLAPEHSADFNPPTLRDLRRPTLFLGGSGTIGGSTTTFEHAPDYIGAGAVGGILNTEGSTFAPQVDATLVWPVNEGIGVGGVAMVDHNSNRSVTTRSDFTVDPENEVTTEYSTLQTDYKAGALFLIEAFGLDIGATAALEGSTSPAREKFDWTEDNTNTYVTENEITSTGFDVQVGAQRRGDPLSLGGSVLLWQGSTDTTLWWSYDSDATLAAT